MVKEEYIKKVPSSEGLRSYHLVLPRKGKKLIKASRHSYCNMALYLQQEMGEEKYNEFIRLLREANEKLLDIKESGGIRYAYSSQKCKSFSWKEINRTKNYCY